MNRRSSRRRKPPGATTRGGWGAAHQHRREAIALIVRAGKATCARCNEPIHPDHEWHLDHNDTRDGYLGVSHVYCNLAAGAHKETVVAAQSRTSNSPTAGHGAGSMTRPSEPSTRRRTQPRD